MKSLPILNDNVGSHAWPADRLEVSRESRPAEERAPTGPLAKRPLPMTMDEAKERGGTNWTLSLSPATPTSITRVSRWPFWDGSSRRLAIALESCPNPTGSRARIGAVSDPAALLCDQRGEYGFDDQPLHRQ